MIDDGGTRRRLLVLESGEADAAALIARLQSHLAGQKLFDSRFVFALVCGFIVFLIPALVVIELLIGTSGAAFFGGLLLFGIGVGLASIHIGRRRFERVAQAFARTMLAAGRCGCCGYRLAGLGHEETMVACPECGGKWKREAIGEGEIPRSAAAAAPASARPFLAAWFGPRTTLDARGTIVEIIADPLLRRGAADPVYAAERAKLREALASSIIPRRRVNAIMMFVFAFFCLALGVAMAVDLRPLTQAWRDPGGVLVTIIPLFGAPLLLRAAWQLWTERSGYHTAGIIAALLAVDRCPSCGGRLAAEQTDEGRMVDEEPDGEASQEPDIRSCAHCAARWGPSHFAGG